jgi:CRP-like cAMP-binding protein
LITKPVTRRPTLDATLAARETLQHPPSGTLLFDEGEPPRGIYIVHAGSIDLLFRSRSGGELKRVRSAIVGEILGLDSVVSCRSNDYAARIVTASTVGFIDKETFSQMLDGKSGLWLDVLTLLSQDVNASYDSLRHAGIARV